MKDLVLIGGGGHCRSCIDVIESAGNFRIKGILDNDNTEAVSGYAVTGGDERIPQLVTEGCSFLITVGHIKSADTRKKLYELLLQHHAELATVIAATALVSKHAVIGRGSIIMHNAVVNAGAVTGINNIINTGALVEHDAVTGSHCHVSTHAVINGNCRIGDEVFIGSNAVINHGIVIGDKVIIGSGTVIHRNITEAGTYSGTSFIRRK